MVEAYSRQGPHGNYKITIWSLKTFSFRFRAHKTFRHNHYNTETEEFHE